MSILKDIDCLVVGLEKVDNEKSIYFPKVIEEFKNEFKTKFITTEEFEKNYEKAFNYKLSFLPVILFIAKDKTKFNTGFGLDSSEEDLRLRCKLFSEKINKEIKCA